MPMNAGHLMQKVVRKPNWKVLSKPKMKLSASATNKQTNKLMDGRTECISPRKLRRKMLKN